jgi:hypothetical protein
MCPDEAESAQTLPLWAVRPPKSVSVEMRIMVSRSGLFGYHQGQFEEASGECFPQAR